MEDKLDEIISYICDYIQKDKNNLDFEAVNALAELVSARAQMDLAKTKRLNPSSHITVQASPTPCNRCVTCGYETYHYGYTTH